MVPRLIQRLSIENIAERNKSSNRSSESHEILYCRVFTGLRVLVAVSALELSTAQTSVGIYTENVDFKVGKS